MKTPVLIVALLMTSALVGANAADQSERPLGIEASNWISVTDKLGFVVVSTTEPGAPRIQGPNPQLLLNKVTPAAPAAGYFMIRTEDGWRRLIVMTPSDLAATVRG